MSKFFDTWFTARLGNNAVSTGCTLALACCCCAGDNIANALEQDGENNSPVNFTTVLKGGLMLAGLGIGIYCDYLATPAVFNAIVAHMAEHTEAANWSIQFLAGTVNGMVDILLPLSGFNLGGWGARGMIAGFGQLSPALFRPKDQTATSVEEPHPQERPVYTV